MTSKSGRTSMGPAPVEVSVSCERTVNIILHELNYWVDFENKYESWFKFTPISCPQFD
jgi:hypothetical protein